MHTSDICPIICYMLICKTKGIFKTVGEDIRTKWYPFGNRPSFSPLQ